MKKLGLGKRALACAVSAATLLTGTTALSAVSHFCSTTTASAASSDNYAKLLQYSMYFYDGNMCGKNAEEASQFDWRGDCHTSDEVDGGFHDAGDHVKFGLPAGYAASTLGWGYYEFKDSYDKLGQSAHLQTITDYFCKFFKDSTVLSGNSVSKFCYQIGAGQADHDVWCAPEVQNDQSLRTPYWTTNDASDIAAEYAAALAVNYVNFGNAEDLTYAKALYDFSIKNNKASYDGAGNFYNSYDYYDDQAWAAGWLYLATNDSTYKDFLNKFMNDSNAGKSGQSGCKWGIYSPHSWNNVSLGAGILQAEITGAAADWAKVNTYLSGKCSGSGYYCEDSWGSCRYNTAMQMAALAANKHYSQINFNSWCKSQMGMILGDNPINTNFVVGFDSNSAKYAHHRAASGYSSFDEFKNLTGYSSNGHTLVGALVGGPSDANFTYTDSINDYQCNEVAIDYNAALVGAAAGLYALYGTGTIDSSIEGVSDMGNVTTTQATKETKETTTTTVTTADSDLNENDKLAIIVPGEEKGDDGNLFKYVEFSTNGAVSATAYFTSSSNDTEASVAFGTWNGEWVQEDSKVAISSGQEVAVDYTIPSDVGSTVKFMVFYPSASDVEISKVVLHSGGSVDKTTETTKQTTVTTKSTTTTTVSTNGGNSGQEANLTTGTEKGDDGKIYKYAEFRPNGAKTATAYFDVSSNDTEASGSFGTWTGEWLQEDFNVSVVNGKASVTYNIPSNVGETVKFSVYWPGADSVDNIKIVLDDNGGNTTNTTTTDNGGNTSGSDGKYVLDLHQKVVYSDLPTNDKMFGWEWSKFGIKDGETIQKVVINLSTKMEEIGKWQGAFGSSTSVAPDYWTQTEDMEEVISGKTGAITWNIDAATAATIQTQYGGELKFGVWWIDCDSFYVESVEVYTDANKGGSDSTTTSTSQSTTTTTTTTTATTATSTTKQTVDTHTSLNIPPATLYGDVNVDGKVDLADAILLNKACAGIVTMTEQQYANADVCTDPGVGGGDAVVLLRFLAHLTMSIPADE